jgi:5-methylcytosine-specific restriction endonuclease McrA
MPYVNKKRPYKKEYKQQKARGEKERLRRNAREQARYEAKNKGKDGKITDVKGEDIDHKKPLSKGGTNKASNLRSVSPSKNRSFSRNSDGSVKKNVPKKKTAKKKTSKKRTSKKRTSKKKK